MKTSTHLKWVLGILLSALAVLTFVTISISRDTASLAIATHIVHPAVVATLHAKDILQSKKTTAAVTPSALPLATAAVLPSARNSALNYRAGEHGVLASSDLSTSPWFRDGRYPSTGGLVPPNDQPHADIFFEDYGVNPFIDTEDDSLSTFAVDVDTAAYTVMRRFVHDGFLPPDESVRVEEYINFFEQDYLPPTEGPFAIHLEAAPSPYRPEPYYLARVGIQGYETPSEDRQDVVLTFVIDVSGSMGYENRLELVKDALALLVEELRPSDKVGIVTYGNYAEVVLEHTPVGENQWPILRAIAGLRAGGSTYAEAGLVTGYDLASEAFDPEFTNRVILCSDGVANVGRTGQEAILRQIRNSAANQIYLTTVGFGMGNYNDILMEQLADNGNGFYTYVDSLKEAERVFVNDLTSTLQVIAKDAKIQVEFNPAVVSRYRLMGYENRDVTDQDFRNDTVDAGEIGAGHSVTALYEFKLHSDGPATGSVLTVSLRHEDPESGEVAETSRAFDRADFSETIADSSPRFQLDAVVAEYAEILRHSYWARDASLEEVGRKARSVARYFPGDSDVQEFAKLVRQAIHLSDTG